MDNSDKTRFLYDLEEAIRALEAKLGPNAPYVRPFICDGPVTACEVFVVGVNPRENMQFRPYWNGSEFDKVKWEKDYLWQRYKRAIAEIAAGRKPNDLASRTRKKIEVFSASAFPARVLETNIYAVASAEQGDLELHPEYKEDAIFSLLLRSLRPRVVITHGATARHYICRLLVGNSGPYLADGSDPKQFTELRRWGPEGATTYFRALKHLGGRAGSACDYQWMRQLGLHVRELVPANEASGES